MRTKESERVQAGTSFRMQLQCISNFQFSIVCTNQSKERTNWYAFAFSRIQAIARVHTQKRVQTFKKKK